MCLVLECCMGFLVRQIALMLSHLIGMWSMAIPKSSNCCFIHKTCVQQLPAATYSTSVMDNATLCCFFENHDMSIFPGNWQVLQVLFLSNLHPPKSASEYACKIKDESLGYYKPRLGVSLRYLKILFTASKCDSLRHDWYLAHKQIVNMISGLPAIR